MPGDMLFALPSVKLVLQWIHGDEHEAVIAVLARKMDDECQHAPLLFTHWIIQEMNQVHAAPPFAGHSE